jgi:hypothetical protein
MGAAVVTLPALAQQPRGAGPYRIALVPELTPASGLQEFVGFLRDAGRIEGRDFVLLRAGFQYGQPWEAMIKLAVEASPDLIVAGNTALARAYQKLRTHRSSCQEAGFHWRGVWSTALRVQAET